MGVLRLLLGSKGGAGVRARGERHVSSSSRECFVPFGSEEGDLGMRNVFVVTGFYRRLNWFSVSLLTYE